MSRKNHLLSKIPNLKVVILAAGKGKRLHSDEADLPKVLRQVCGRPLLSYVLDHVPFVEPRDIIIVVGYQAEKVCSAMGPAYQYVLQKEQLGTGHAVAVTKPLLQDFTGDVLVIYGDMPLMRAETYHKLVLAHQAEKSDCTLLTAVTDQFPDYGRILRDEKGRFAGIVEQKDCTPEQLLIDEVNPGVYVFRCEALLSALDHLNCENVQGEYYLTDVPSIMLRSGLLVNTVTIIGDEQLLGVNTPEDLDRCERILKESL